VVALPSAISRNSKLPENPTVSQACALSASYELTTFADMQRYIRVSVLNYNKCEVNAVSKISQGFIMNYRRGARTGIQKSNECILRFPGIESIGGAGRLLGRKVAWPVGKHEVRGKIVAVHGKNGFVRARFRKGVPGQALGSLVEIIG